MRRWTERKCWEVKRNDKGRENLLTRHNKEISLNHTAINFGIILDTHV